MRNSSLYFILLCLLFHCSLSIPLIDQNCEEASKHDPTVKYDFCVKSLESNPKSKNVSTLAELTLISVEVTKSNATNIISYVSQLLKNKNLVLRIKRALKDCLELYLDAKYDLDGVKKALIAKDYNTATTYLSAVGDASTTCEDEFEENEGEISLTKENNDFYELDLIALIFTNKLISS